MRTSIDLSDIRKSQITTLMVYRSRTGYPDESVIVWLKTDADARVEVHLPVDVARVLSDALSAHLFLSRPRNGGAVSWTEGRLVGPLYDDNDD